MPDHSRLPHSFMSTPSCFFDLGGLEEGLGLIREIVSRDWHDLGEDEREDLVQEGYLELERLRAEYDPARCDSFEAYARTFLPLRLRDRAAKMCAREEPAAPGRSPLLVAV